MSSREYWFRMCERCERVYNKYGNDIPLATDPSDDPVKEFEATDVS